MGAMMDKKADLYRQIGASLKDGMVFHKGLWCFVYAFLVFCLIVPVGSIVYCLLVLFRLTSFSNEDAIPLIGSNIGCLLTSVGVIYVLIKKLRLKKKIYMCIDDAVELRGKTIAIDRIYYPIRPATKLMVRFRYEKKWRTLYSGDPSKNYYLFKNHGYYKVLEKYVGEHVKILYSPKYNEIFFFS